MDIGRWIERYPVVALATALGVGLLIYSRTGGSLSDLWAGVKPKPKDNVVIGADAGSGVAPETTSATYDYITPQQLDNYFRTLQQQIDDQRAALEREIADARYASYNSGPGGG